MEPFPIAWDPLTSDLSTPQRHTAATMATLSIQEAPPGLVGVMECGVGQLQLVRVSGMDLNCFLGDCIPVQ